jgi:hypothetical protein
MRIHDPLKQWKLSPMDMESRTHWEEYTKAKEEMLARTHTDDARWWVVQAVDKKRARLNCIAHLLSQVPYGDVPKPEIALPARVRHADYVRTPVPAELFVPEVYWETHRAPAPPPPAPPPGLRRIKTASGPRCQPPDSGDCAIPSPQRGDLNPWRSPPTNPRPCPGAPSA